MKMLATSMLLLLSAEASAAEKLQKIALSTAQQDAMMRVITKDFFDPEAAKIRNLRSALETISGELLVCGEINGKNRLGGYVGYRQFVAATDKGQSVWGGYLSQQATDRKMTSWCAERGLAEAP